MLNATFYEFLMDVSGAFYSALAAARQKRPPTEPPPPILQLRRGYAESPAWFLLQAAEFDPEPLTVDNLRVRDVYASERLVRALLELMASEKWLARTGETYALTEAGRAVLTQVRERPRALLITLQPLPADALIHLERTLRSLITASLVSPAPPGTWCLAHSRRRAPSAEAAPLLQIFHSFDDFNAFRDDAHMAAWQPLGVAGFEWEAFSLVGQGEAVTASALFERLHYRGCAQRDYAEALRTLTQHGWLVADALDAYRVTSKGQALRAQVESLTDQYFYAPWEALTPADLASLRAQLEQLRDALLASSHGV